MRAQDVTPAPDGASGAAGEAVRSAAQAVWNFWGDYSFSDPWFLLLGPPGLALLLWGRSRGGRASARVPLLPGLRAPRTWRQRLAWLPVLLQALAFLLVVVAMSRPLRGSVERSVTSEGVDICLLLDRSSSMQFDDLNPGQSRLDVVKEVAGDFARRRMTDTVGAADSVALISFARYPQLLCPFTLDANAVTGFLDQTEIVRYKPEDGTAIGTAIAKAVQVLKDSEAESKVVVLLTDGENTVDAIEPLAAAELAAELGIRVHTIFAARYVYMADWFGQVRATSQRQDTTELERIAAITGGRFFMANNKERLEEIYALIEELERTPRTEERFVETFDLYPLFLLPALLLYLSAWLSSATWARRLT